MDNFISILLVHEYKNNNISVFYNSKQEYGYGSSKN